MPFIRKAFFILCIYGLFYESVNAQSFLSHPPDPAAVCDSFVLDSIVHIPGPDGFLRMYIRNISELQIAFPYARAVFVQNPYINSGDTAVYIRQLAVAGDSTDGLMIFDLPLYGVLAEDSIPDSTQFAGTIRFRTAGEEMNCTYVFAFTYGTGPDIVTGVKRQEGAEPVTCSVTNSAVQLRGLPDKTSIQMLNVNGQVLGLYTLSAVEETIPISHLPVGMYILHIRAGNSVIAHKFIKE